MGVLLKEIMKLPCFKDAKIVCGTIENDNTYVNGITIIEAPDIVNWIKGGELLLTSFYSIDKDLKAQVKLVSTLAEKGAAALIIKTSRFINKIPVELIRIGNEVNFPIIEISGDTKYIDIMYPVMAEVFNEQVNRLNYYKECHDRFTKLSLTMKGVKSVVQTLEELIMNPVIIYDNEFEPIYCNRKEFMDIEISGNKKEIISEDKQIYAQEVIVPSLGNKLFRTIFEPINVLNQIKAYLAVPEINKPIGELDFIAIEGAATTLRLEMLKDVAINEVELKYKGDLINDIIKGRFESDQSIYERAKLFKMNLHRKFIIVILNIDKYDRIIKNHKNIPGETQLLREKIKKILDRISYHYVKEYIKNIRNNNIVIFWPVNDVLNGDIYYGVKTFSNEVRNTIKKEIGDIDISIGIGSLANNLQEISKSYYEAKDAVEFGKRIFGNDSITVFEELGIYRLLCKYENRNELKEFIHPALIKLAEYDSGKNNELLETLEAYLKCNLNAVKTAEELFVHYKTVLYRLNRIREISGLNIDNREKMLEIEIGLKILKISS